MWARTCLYQGYIWLPKWQMVLLICLEEGGNVFPDWDDRGCPGTTEGKRDTWQSPLTNTSAELSPLRATRDHCQNNNQDYKGYFI